jgi:GTP-binding protein
VLDASGGLEERDPLVDFRTINEEIAEFDPEMSRKPMLVALNKVDVPEARENIPGMRQVLKGEGFRVFPISAATGEGVQDLFAAVGEQLRNLAEAEADERKAEAARPKRRVYTIGNVDERAWDAQRIDEDSFRVTGVGVERFTRMTNFDLREGGERFQRMLERNGIASELERLGIQDGDTVYIAEHELLWGNQPDDDGAFVMAGNLDPTEFEWVEGDDDEE